MAGEPGFEPGLTDPESVVLPLDDSPARQHYNLSDTILKNWPVFFIAGSIETFPRLPHRNRLWEDRRARSIQRSCL